MTPARRAAGVAVALLAMAAPVFAGCELVLSEHRSGRELRRLPLDAAAPAVQVAFEHSVLGTTVVDHYRFRPQPVLVEEHFAGAGYGLPHAAGPGEHLQRDGDGWVLTLERPVQPLVVRALPAQHMRLLLPQGVLPLAGLGASAVVLAVQGCSGHDVARAPR
jgi:hypothetical protein